jgi:hypothetical protein
MPDWTPFLVIGLIAGFFLAVSVNTSYEQDVPMLPYEQPLVVLAVITVLLFLADFLIGLRNN